MSRLKKTELSRAHLLSLFGLFKWFDALDLSQLKQGETPVRIPFKFSYAMGLNFPIVGKFVEAYASAMKKDADYQTYLSEESALNERHAEKDGRGRAVRNERGGYKIADPVAYGEAFLALREKYRDAIDRRDDFLSEFESVELYTVDPEHVPEILSPPQIRILIPMIPPRGVVEETTKNKVAREPVKEKNGQKGKK